MGITSPADHTLVPNDGAVHNKIAQLDWEQWSHRRHPGVLGTDCVYHNHRWCLVQPLNSTICMLVLDKGGLVGVSSGIHFTFPIYRFNRFRQLPAPSSPVGSLPYSVATDIAGKEYRLDPEKYDETEWFPKAAMGLIDYSESFYDEKLAESARVKRTNKKKSKSSLTRSAYEHFSIAHLRLRTGLSHEVDAFLPWELDTKIGDFIDEICHIRYKDGEPVSKLSAVGGVTLAYAIQATSKEDLYVVTYAMSVCSNENRYDRVEGLDRAVARLNANLGGNMSGDKSLTGAVMMKISPDHIRSTRSGEDTGFYELRAPFYPNNKVMQLLLLLITPARLAVTKKGLSQQPVTTIQFCAAASLLGSMDRSDWGISSQVEKEIYELTSAKYIDFSKAVSAVYLNWPSIGELSPRESHPIPSVIPADTDGAVMAISGLS